MREGKLNYAGHDLFWNQRFEHIHNTLLKDSPERQQQYQSTKNNQPNINNLIILNPIQNPSHFSSPLSG